jgi:hypothetical protein
VSRPVETCRGGVRTLARRRYSTDEAARALGISVDAVRKRVERDQLPHEREGSRLYVLLDDVATESRPDVEGESSALISQLRDEITYLREESRRKDEIIMQQAITMRQLSVPAEEGREDAPESPPSPGPTQTPPDTGEGPETATEPPDRGDVPGDHREAQEAKASQAKLAWGEKWEMRLVGVFAAIVLVLAVLVLASAVLTP